jgi:OPA family glycerol-3-phosphate transporter-like MFS transporter/OPA family sugar phosphate sensor protein UhpC-like MFS transporter
VLAFVRRLFAPPPDRPLLAVSPDELRARYRGHRIRQLWTTFAAYAVFYLVRKNIPVALPLVQRDLGYSKAALGGFLTAHDLVYGVSKFANGILADRTNARVFLATGLVLSALANIAFGASSGLIALAAFWTLNGWFQGMGFPPCARVLSHWFGTRERGTTWGLWNTSHQVGAAVIFVLAGSLAARFGWRACFYVPAVLATLTSAFVAVRLFDTPGSVGLPPVETYTGEAPRAQPEGEVPTFGRTLRERVFGNRFVWLICGANFFVYVVRYAIVNWAPSYLHERKGFELTHAGWTIAGFEIAGLAGSLLAGWVSDRFLRSRRGPVCVAFMVALAVAVLAFLRVPPGHAVLDAALLWVIGFLVYGPQFLVGVMAADLVGKEAAASAIGLTGLFGYASGLVSGVGLGWVVDHSGWDGGLELLIGCALAGAALFGLTWNATGRTVPTADAGEIRTAA